MKKFLPWLFTACLAATAAAQDRDLRATLFEPADEALAAAQSANAAELAPDSFEAAMDAYSDAEADLERGRDMERIRNHLDAAERGFEAAVEAAEIARITLSAVIKTRDDARNANASTFAAEQWAEAESEFDAATRRLESDDIRRARSSAESAEALYRDAELIAIKAQYLSQTRALLAEAEQARVPRYAPRTFEAAEALLEQAERELNENRYDTDLPRSLAQQANYEARHAIGLAQRIVEIRDQRLSEEDLILSYEEPLKRIAAAADIVAPLDRGVDPVTDELVAYIEQLRESSSQTERDLAESRTRIAELEDEIRSLDEQLGGVSQERVALVQRLEAEARVREQFDTIQNLFTRDEARVSREEDDVVLRLVGLTFGSGRSTVEPGDRELLAKVARAATVFPRSQIVVEGHTDSYGNDDSNLTLSRNRAEAVGAFLGDEFGIPRFRISAVGYGETRPIANNETEQGRARNRRIDIRIEPELE